MSQPKYNVLLSLIPQDGRKQVNLGASAFSVEFDKAMTADKVTVSKLKPLCQEFASAVHMKFTDGEST
jgi:hypothetical protein